MPRNKKPARRRTKSIVDQVSDKRQRLEQKVNQTYNKCRKSGKISDMRLYHEAESKLEEFNDRWRNV